MRYLFVIISVYGLLVVLGVSVEKQTWAQTLLYPPTNIQTLCRKWGNKCDKPRKQKENSKNPPKTKCDEMGFEHTWWVDTISYVCTQQGYNPSVCFPRIERCLNCGLERTLVIEHKEYWNYKLPEDKK